MRRGEFEREKFVSRAVGLCAAHAPAKGCPRGLLGAALLTLLLGGGCGPRALCVGNAECAADPLLLQQPQATDRYTVQGESVRSVPIPGAVTVAYFWHSSCLPCRGTLPKLEALHQRWGPRGVRFMALTNDTNPGLPRAIFSRLGVSFPLRLDNADQTFFKAFGCEQVPQLILFDRAGRVRFVQRRSEESAENLARALELL